jgi:hypothetical protein
MALSFLMVVVESGGTITFAAYNASAYGRGVGNQRGRRREERQPDGSVVPRREQHVHTQRTNVQNEIGLVNMAKTNTIEIGRDWNDIPD